jgi:hypothetical protein
MTVCPLLYNLSNFIRLGPGPSYKFWEVINYRRGINDEAQSLIPMTVCPLLYNLSNFIRLGPGPSYKFGRLLIIGEASMTRLNH